MVVALLTFASFAIAVAGLDAPIPGDKKRFISRYAATDKPVIDNSPPRSHSSTPLQSPQLSSAAHVVSAPMGMPASAPMGMPASAPMGMPAIAYDATQCKTLEELEAWRHQVHDHIQKFVPKPYQEFAGSSIESKYQQRKTELETAGSSVGARDPPEVFAVSAGGPNNAGTSIDSSSWHADQPRLEPHNAGGDLRHMLAEVVNCNSREELEAWRSGVREFVDKELPPQFKPFALADMQRHFEIRLADLRKVSTAPDAQVLAQMLADADRCTSEPELVIWRENVASHIRSHLVPRFQIPALADMQMRFDRRMDILQKGASSPQLETSATVESSKIAETVAPVAGFGTFTVVLGGLLLPACMAVFAAFIRGRQKVLATPICDGETQLLEA